ncbi:MAG TPA: hypothetical protein VGR58_06010 [Candidatus Acidoferrum sp.]|nr:hypothetical protein [Candidatus Acidoferrum sp.]
MKIAGRAACVILFAVVALEAAAQTTKVEVRRLALAEARPVIEAYANALPEGLPAEATRDPKAWSRYVEQREKELQARLEQGDLDTLANLLLFGTSFTTEPVLTPARLQQISAQAQGTNKETAGTGNAYQGRLRDLAIGIAYPKGNERLQYMRSLLQKKGFQFATAEDYNKLGSFLASNLLRMLGDNQKLAEALERARQADSETEFRERSQVFERRGISLDTSIFPNFALEEALKALKEQGVLRAGSVRRLAVVGPGLDTMNKDVGFDYYPEQTNQPFAVADSLLRLGLAREGQLQVTTLDISERVNAHLRAARTGARNGAGYTLQLPIRSNIEWTKEALSYWEEVGSAIGEKATPMAAPPGADDPKTRAVKVRPAIVLRVRPKSLDVVYERLVMPAEERFDLIVGTNIFVYYGAFEQTLAELNLAAMLRDGGVVLTNDSLPTNGGSAALNEIGFSTTVYSDRKNDGDRVVWLQRRPPAD